MRTRNSPREALSALAQSQDTQERRVRWRQALTALGEAGRIDRPPPLDGLPRDSLIGAVRTALGSGLIDDLDWAAPERVAVALYEMTSAMPAGPERTALGRRMFSRLYQGTATTFAAVATHMALHAGKSLEIPALQARVHLLYSLPIGSSVNADSLALTLLARPELFQRWVARPASGTLPARTMASIILERAAREIVRCTERGDPAPLACFGDPRVQAIYQRLLADREPLVWRHAAVARGLLSAVQPPLREEIDLQLDPSLSPTEWRRAAVSLSACLVSDPKTALQQCKSLLRSDLFDRHPAILSTLLWGLGPVLETDPDLAQEVIDFTSWVDRTDIAQNLASLLRDLKHPGIGQGAATRMINGLAERLESTDSGTSFRLQALMQELDIRRRGDTSIAGAVRSALRAFESTGAEAAHDLAREALDRSLYALKVLEKQSGEEASAETYRILRDLDAGTVENSKLYCLLLLGRRPGDSNASVAEMEGLYDRFGSWLLNRTGPVDETTDPEGTLVLHQQRWLSLLHLIDVETSAKAGNEHVANRIGWRIRQAIRTLLAHLEAETNPRLHRVLCATLARSFDAAVREGVADVSDLLLLSVQRLHQSSSVEAVVEASAAQESRNALQAYARFLAQAGPPKSRRSHPPSMIPRAPAQHYREIAEGLRLNASYRGEALRQTLLRLSRCLQGLQQANSVGELLDGEHHQIDELESACGDLAKLSQSAAARVLDDPGAFAESSEDDSLSKILSDAASAGSMPDEQAMLKAIDALCAPLPCALADPLALALSPLRSLPLTAPTGAVSRRPRQHNVLPDWLLPRRTIGGFYVVSALGVGGAASVFVARRIEARRQSGAELYALKVPKYDATVARSLSEQEFLEMFRQEAGALLSLPRHENLARFVNFDVEARPKPILVMELIDGSSLDRCIRRRLLSTKRAFQYLDGILAGLEAMHSKGVGHLDLKPANVILRDQSTAVLVDFGLSGRHIRPGCGTLEYCSPEILGVIPGGHEAPPACADMYAFACLAFETLTTKYVIDGPDETAVITNHINHDGWPDRLAEFSRMDGNHELAMLLARCMRKEPGKRPSASEVRRALALPAHDLESRPWPLQTGRDQHRDSEPIPLVAGRR